MEILSITFAYLQLPMVIALAWHCIQVRHQVSGWIGEALLAVVGCCVFFLAWRLSTLNLIIDPATRAAGGLAVQTLFIIAIFVLVSAIRELSGQNK